jgi:general secretion pathway protein B
VSFILDALRKSETERQRQAGPGLVDAGYRPPARRRSVWLPLLALVLTANLALMAWYLLRPVAPDADAPHAGAPAGTAATGMPAAPPAAPPAATAAAPSAGRSLADAAGVAAPEEGPWEATADLPASDGAVEAGVPEAAAEPAAGGVPPAAATAATGIAQEAAGAAPARPAIVEDDLPTATQLMESGAIPPRPLHLDIHVWSDVPAERFVFLNMRKYGEGAELPDGARIEEITRDGVVLSQSGQRFVLNRD